MPDDGRQRLRRRRPRPALSCKVGSKKYKATGDFLSIIAYYDTTTGPVPFVGITATLQGGLPERTMTLIVPIDLPTPPSRS